MKQLIGRNSKLEVVGRNKNGVLFSVNTNESFNTDCNNIIYIMGSQFDHYDENGTLSVSPFGKNYTYGHHCDWYDEDNRPYIFKYIVAEDSDNSQNFSQSLIELTKLLNTNNNIVIGKSYGGIIGMVSSYSDVFKSVILVNPSIQGSPLSDEVMLKNYKSKKIPDIIIKFCCNFILEKNRGFTLENAKGIEIIENDKLIVFGGTINELIPNNLTEQKMKMGATVIMRMSGQRSDGVACFDENEYLLHGIPVVNMPMPYHIYTQDRKYMSEIFDMLKEKRVIS
ncbi:MAG: hypothetical protein RSB76_03285 [Clostridia bacterium]